MNGVSFLRSMNKFFFVIVFLLWGISVLGQESPFTVSGYYEGEGFFMPSPRRDESKNEYAINKIENHVKLDLLAEKESVVLKSSIHGFAYPDTGPGHMENRLLVQELYLQVFSENADVRAGRQVIRWGSADSINPTAFFVPRDYSELFMKDDDERNLGVDAVSFTYMFGDFSLVLAGVPLERKNIYPENTSPWALRFADYDLSGTAASLYRTYYGRSSVPVEFNPSLKELEPEAEHISYGGRLAGTIKALDFSLSGYHGVDRDVVLVPEAVMDTYDTGTGTVLSLPGKVVVTPAVEMITAFGIDFSFAAGDFTINGEGIYSHNKTGVISPDFDDSTVSVLKKTHFIQYTAGINWIVSANRLNFIGEYSRGQYLVDGGQYNDPFLSDVAASRLELKLYNQKIILSAGGMFNVEDHDWMATTEGEYRGENSVSVSAGAVLFGGEEETLFGSYKHRDLLRVMIKYSF